MLRNLNEATFYAWKCEGFFLMNPRWSLEHQAKLARISFRWHILFTYAPIHYVEEIWKVLVKEMLKSPNSIRKLFQIRMSRHYWLVMQCLSTLVLNSDPNMDMNQIRYLSNNAPSGNQPCVDEGWKFWTHYQKRHKE